VANLDSVVIVLFEVIGTLLVAAGAGVAAGWLIGWAGMIISGIVVLIAAGVSSYQQTKVAQELLDSRQRTQAPSS
jgi:hypothetical protein